MPQNPFDPEPFDDVAVAPARPALRRPSLWHAVMVNDNFTPMEFVVVLLVQVFDLTLAQAQARMLEVHHAGQAIVGTYPKEVGQAKVDEALALADHEGHPLLVRLERAPSPDSDAP